MHAGFCAGRIEISIFRMECKAFIETRGEIWLKRCIIYEDYITTRASIVRHCVFSSAVWFMLCSKVPYVNPIRMHMVVVVVFCVYLSTYQMSEIYSLYVSVECTPFVNPFQRVFRSIRMLKGL